MIASSPFYRYIVVPTKAKGFIEEVREAKKAAEKFDGYITYNLVKPVVSRIGVYLLSMNPKSLHEYQLVRHVFLCVTVWKHKALIK